MKHSWFFRTMLILSLLCLLICCPAAAQEAACYPDSALKDFPATFFAPADNYMAVLKDTTHPISFYAVYQSEQPFEGRTIERMVMANEENILFNNAIGEQDKSLSERLSARSLLTEATFPEAGRFEFDRITLLFTDGSRETYPIGRFVIEVFDDQDSDVLNTYVTPAMTSNNTYLPCEYVWQRDGLAFAGLDMDLAAEHELLFAREEPFAYASEDSPEGGGKAACFAMETQLMAERPTVYHFILPRVRVRVDGVEQAVYPKLGCYCGGLEVTETEVLEAYEAWYLS